MQGNTAAWITTRRADLDVTIAQYTAPKDDEIVVRNRAVAINPLDWILQNAGELVFSWIQYPFILGSDLAGDVVEVGKNVTRFKVGQRVLGHAVGTDPGRTLLIWGGSTSSGSNAIQRAVVAGYEVIATASRRNFDYVRRLGASQVFDYGSKTVVRDIVVQWRPCKHAASGQADRPAGRSGAVGTPPRDPIQPIQPKLRQGAGGRRIGCAATARNSALRLSPCGTLAIDAAKRMQPGGDMTTDNTYLAVFIGSKTSPRRKAWDALPEAERRTKEREGVSAWHAWVENHQAAIVAMGGPLGSTKQVAPDGIRDTTNHMGAFTVVRAPSHEAAARLFTDHPHFAIFPGESVEIMPVLPIPGR